MKLTNFLWAAICLCTQQPTVAYHLETLQGCSNFGSGFRRDSIALRILRLRGGALYGASLTRWQHSDPTITEVTGVIL